MPALPRIAETTGTEDAILNMIIDTLEDSGRSDLAGNLVDLVARLDTKITDQENTVEGLRKELKDAEACRTDF